MHIPKKSTPAHSLHPINFTSPPIVYEWIMSTNITASSNTGQTVPIREEERNVSEDVTDDTDLTASTRVPRSEGGLCPYQTKPAFR